MSYLILICITCYALFITFILSGLFRHKISKVSSYDALPRVSVVIAARNEENQISDLINDLIIQEYPIDQLEIVLVNDRSTDSTLDIITEASNNYAFIKVVSINEESKEMTPKKNALTKGIESALGEIVVLTDADCRVGKLWVSSMAYSVMNQNCISIGFSEVTNENDSLFDRYQRIDFFSIIIANAGVSGWGAFWSGSGQNLAFYKNDFEAIGGFQDVRNRISGDDMYLVQAISNLKNGYVHIDPNSFVKTSPVKSVSSFFNQRVRWSSNAKMNFYDAPLFFGFLLTMMIYNLLILFSFLLGNPWLGLLCIKFILDALVIFLGGKLFDRNMDILAYCVWAILQPIYVPLIGVWGIRGKFYWKP